MLSRIQRHSHFLREQNVVVGFKLLANAFLDLIAYFPRRFMRNTEIGGYFIRIVGSSYAIGLRLLSERYNKGVFAFRAEFSRVLFPVLIGKGFGRIDFFGFVGEKFFLFLICPPCRAVFHALAVQPLF